MENNKNKKITKIILNIVIILLLLVLMFFITFFATKLRIEKSFKEEINNLDKGETKTFETSDKGVDNSSIFKIYALKKEAYNKGMNRNYYGILEIPSVNIKEKVFKGANKYTLSLGVATDFYEDAEPGKGNFVIAGHNFGVKDVLLSNLDNVKIGEEIKIKVGSTEYKYKITKKEMHPDHVIIDHGEISDPLFKYPEIGEKPLITIYTCEPFGITRQRIVVQGELID